MSTLTDRLDACIPHTPHCGDACYCGSARRKLAEAQTAVVAEWLTTPGAVHVVATGLLGRTATMGALEGLSLLAAEAVKGAE